MKINIAPDGSIVIETEPQRPVFKWPEGLEIKLTQDFLKREDEAEEEATCNS